MNAHHYSYKAGLSTFIIEMTPNTFENTRFSDMTESEYQEQCEQYFAHQLGTAKLISNNSVWRRFPVLSCQTWHHDNMVLVGDALHTAHFSIGSGTRLALEDVIALVKSLQLTEWDISAALPAYQAIRQPILEKIITAARRSAHWYEHFDQHMELEPWQFALSYIQRAGRIDFERLQQLAPNFTEQLIARGIESDTLN
jgi:2-polyprenyl-6-methoxyphenol hydroxylase-like FAD-dependent oxidoreductase